MQMELGELVDVRRKGFQRQVGELEVEFARRVARGDAAAGVEMTALFEAEAGFDGTALFISRLRFFIVTKPLATSSLTGALGD